MAAKRKTQWPADKVERIAIDKLVPYARNARTHSDEQVAQIAASMREWGWTNPVLIDEDGGIIAGHGRVLAARKLGLTDAPCMTATGWSDAKKRAYVLADNKLAMNSGWDNDLLRTELQELSALDFDMPLIGFDDAELDALLTVKTEGLTDPDEAPEPPVNPVTVTGDTWILGKHRLRCGDSTGADDVGALLAGVEPHLMVTDPPYGVDYDASWSDGGIKGVRENKKVQKVLNDDRSDWQDAWSLFPGDIAYIWHADKGASTVEAGLIACGFQIRAQIIWAKNRPVLSRAGYHWQHEPCWYAVKKGKTGNWAGDRKQSTLWNIDIQNAQTIHSTQKPVECMRRPIVNNSSPGQAVYEPFSGSGTTIIAGEMEGRCIYAMELSPAYVDVAVKRWQEFTGEKATLESTGQTFEEVSQERYDWQDDSAGSYDEYVKHKREELEKA